VATRSQIDNMVATRARPNHKAASSQVSVMKVFFQGRCRRAAVRKLRLVSASTYSLDATLGESSESGLITPKRAGIWA
jgi:hypothetical protein